MPFNLSVNAFIDASWCWQMHTNCVSTTSYKSAFNETHNSHFSHIVTQQNPFPSEKRIPNLGCHGIKRRETLPVLPTW